MFKFRAKAGNKVFKEIVTYNRMLEWCNKDMDKDDFFNMKGIKDHRKVKGASNRIDKWEVLVDWERAESTWELPARMFTDYTVTLTTYAKHNDLLKVWPQCKRYA